MTTMSQNIAELKQEFAAKLGAAGSMQELEEIRVDFLGKKGSVTELLKSMKDLSPEEKKTFGQEVNVLKNELAQAITAKGEELRRAELEREVASMPEFDVSMPPMLERGSFHPITLVQRECENIFKSMGFHVEDYAEIVSDYECFEALNIPKHHPARDMQDTYYLENGQLLKTHTSAAQNAIMKKYGAPLRAIFPGRCFRNE